ncbi:lipoprotein, putative [Geotalea daltonii FRC-32]|uniref:Lipoprotein, putative n=1 Tax=Geotalea daltonii (strain DSM 22248 / JCM 15807 / FRC-32) TaxID=316067 RepID=B9M7M8_GEODF|nr:hypothetical protein [Geotalea daltonii]ACM22134.1 lipoprotein, putative [Geotalea daltonii FRC-32]
MNYSKYLLASLFPLVVTACAATSGTMLQSVAGYPFHHDAFDLKVAWGVTPAEDGVVIAGVVQNVRYLQVRNVDMTVLLLDREKKVQSRGRSFPSPDWIDQDERGVFDLHLTGVTPGKGDLLQFIINYYAMDDASSSFYWISSFTVDALSGRKVASP